MTGFDLCLPEFISIFLSKVYRLRTQLVSLLLLFVSFKAADLGCFTQVTREKLLSFLERFSLSDNSIIFSRRAF